MNQVYLFCAMGCELIFWLVPQFYVNESKVWLEKWYMRMGYKLTKMGDFAQDYPNLNALVAGPCEYRVYLKDL